MKTVYNNFSPYNKLQENLNEGGMQTAPSSLNTEKKQPFDRNWLENYKINPKKDNIIYKNYQNNSLSKWDTDFGSLSPAQKEKYNQFLNTIPTELKGLSANEMQTYLKDISNKQNALTEEKATYDNKIQTLKTQELQRQAAEAQRQAQIRAQQQAAEAQRQAQIRAQQQAATVVQNRPIGRPAIPMDWLERETQRRTQYVVDLFARGGKNVNDLHLRQIQQKARGDAINDYHAGRR